MSLASRIKKIEESLPHPGIATSELLTMCGDDENLKSIFRKAALGKAFLTIDEVVLAMPPDIRNVFLECLKEQTNG